MTCSGTRCHHRIDWQRDIQLTELGFPLIVGKARAMMVQANMLEEIKYKLCKGCFKCAIYFSNFAMATLNGKTSTKK